MIMSKQRLQQRRPLAVMPLSLAAILSLAVSASAALADPVTVTVQGLSFKPASVTVHAGDKVTFVNKDNMAHTVTAQGIWDEKLPPRQSITVLAAKPGEIDYQCSIHPTMKGRVLVEP